LVGAPDQGARSNGPETESLAVGRPLGSIQQFRLVWHYDVVLCSFGYVLSGQFGLCLDWQFWLCLDWAVWVRVQTLWWWDGVFVLLVMS
jgi:hypothetical protein